jgi:hypothetical protein
VKEKVGLGTGNYEYKVVKNGGEAWYPGGANKILSITEEASYDVTFTFNPADESVNATAVKKGSAHIEKYYHVVGSSEAIWGEGGTWGNGIGKDENKLSEATDPDPEQNRLTYAKTYENVDLTPGDIKFKFILSGDWELGNDRVLSISATGTYNVTFYYFPEDSYGYGIAEAVGQVQPLVIEVMSITGELTGGWTTDWTDNNWMDMTQETDNIWSLTVEGFVVEAAKTYYYKAAANHNWNEYCIPGDGSNNDYYFGEAGIYTLKFVANTETDELTLGVEKTGSIEPSDPTLFILGEANDNGWAPNVGVEMTYLDGKFTAEDVTFKGLNDGFSYFSFTTKLAEDPDGWDYITPFRIGAVSDGDFLVTDELLGQEISLTSEGGQALKIPAGIYTLGVNLETMKLVLTKTGTIDPTAVETVEVETANNVYYNLQGQRVAAPTKGIYINNGRKVIVK